MVDSRQNGRAYIQTTAPPGFLLWSGATVNGDRVSSGVFAIDNQQPGMDWSQQKFYFYKPGASGSATPNEGGSVNTAASPRSGGQARSVELSVPAGAVPQTVTLHLTDVGASALFTATAARPATCPQPTASNGTSPWETRSGLPSTCCSRPPSP